MLLTLLLVAQAQSLPAALQTVSLKITKIDERDRTVFVVMAETFDANKPARVQTLRHGPNSTAIEGAHMKKIAALIARDSQRVFVLPEDPSSHQAQATRAALKDAGVKYVAMLE